MKTWPTIRIADVLRRADRFESKDELTEYQFAGTYSYAKGIFVGDLKLGSIFGLPKIQRIRTNDFVYCKIMAWEGAFGIVPPEADDCVLSGAFVAYEIDSTIIEPKFLEYLFKVPSHWKQIGSQSTGTNVRRRSLHPLQFEESKIPCPTLAEQQAIVTRLDQLADNVRQVNEHLDAMETDAEALLRSYIFSQSETGLTKRKMSELVSLRQPDVVVDQLQNYQFAGVYSFGRGVFASVNKTGSEFAYPRLSTIRTGDFIYPKLMAWEGSLGVVPKTCDGLVVSPEFPVFTIDTNEVLPEIIDIYFRTPSVWPELAGISGGTNVRRRRLQPSAFLNYEMPVPPMPTQLKIREMYQRIQTLKTSHVAIRKANQALIPATLEQLFSSEETQHD